MILKICFRILACIQLKQSESFLYTMKNTTDQITDYRNLALFENSLDGVAYFEAVYNDNNRMVDCRYIDMNAAYENFIPVSKKEAIGRTALEILPNTEPEWFETFGKVAQTGEKVSFEMWHEPTKRWYKVSSFRPKGDKDTFVGIFENVTQRKDAEQKLKNKNRKYRELNREYKAQNHELIAANTRLKESEEQYRDILDTYSDIVYVCSPDNRIRYSNTAFQEEFGTDHIGKICHEVINKSKEACEYCRFPSFGSNEPVNNIKHDPTTGKSYRIKTFLLTNNHKLVIFNDITEFIETQKKLENAKLKAQESDNLKSAFLANISHEIRTPMNGIMGCAYLLRETEYSDEDLEEYTSIIFDSGKYLLNLISDIVDISKIEANQLEITEETISLNKLIHDLIQFFKTQIVSKRRDGIRIISKKGLPVGKDFLITDQTRLRQVLVNIISNAVKFTEAGSIVIAYEVVGDELQFSIKDTGIGMSREEMDKIFDRFVKPAEDKDRLYGGTGLGLAISKACVELLGGEIWVESEPGKGSTFYFTVPYRPVYKPEVSNTGKKAIDTTNIFKGKTILVVEDQYTSYKVLKDFLKETEANVIHLKDGKDAVEICKYKDDIDLVLMDINLPRLDGLEATRLIKQYRKDLPVISQTAHAMAEDRKKSLDAGCNDYIAKPIEKDELIRIILENLPGKS